MGCQDLLECVPGRGRVTSVSATPGSISDGKSLKVRAGLSGRSANGKTTKADDLSCKSTLQLTLYFTYFTSLQVGQAAMCTVFIDLLHSLFMACMSLYEFL